MISRSDNLKFLILSTLTFLSCFNSLHAQKAKTHKLSPDEAKEVNRDGAGSFNIQEYYSALKPYTDLVKSAPTNPEYNYRLGVCMIMTNSIKAKAVDYLLAGKDTKEAKKDVNYYLGIAYMNANKWDEAIEALKLCKSSKDFKQPKDNDDKLLPVDRLLEMCENGKELSAHPVDVKFDNMGKIINSITDDYNPYISADQKTLVYASRRKGNMGGMIEGMGIYASDVYSSTYRDSGGWAKGKGVGATLNADWDEEPVGMSHDGNLVFVYFDGLEVFGDIGVSLHKGRSWQKAVMLGPNVNQKSVESSACISNDGQTLYFSSDRKTKDALGGSDLWYCIKQTTGDWGPPVNMGSVINTQYDETSPYISIDGRSLYFSSRGHNSMGGFDIFVSNFDTISKKWSTPKNLGYPINTADDETSFSMTGNGRCVYMAAVREGGMGERDIYKITFNDTTARTFSTVISGVVSASPGKVELREVSLVSKADNKVVSSYKPYLMSNEYVLAGPPGDYILKVDGYGFKPIEEPITLGDADMAKNFSVVLAK